MLTSGRAFGALVLTGLVVSSSLLALSSPLSSEAIREAYFLGQRRDESMARFLEKYKQRLEQPIRGPYIASVEFFTPFARVVQKSREHSVGYSAQQAEEEQRGQEEIVTVNVEVLLTENYGPLIARPTGRGSNAPLGYEFRSSDFWREIEVGVISEDKVLKALNFTGEPTYVCAEHGCTLSGAMLHMEIAAKLFTAGTATVEVTPPEGDEVFVDFDLGVLR